MGALESREPDETIELADAFDCVRLRVAGLGRSTDVTLSVSALLRRFWGKVDDNERDRAPAVRGAGEKEVGARDKLPTELDFASCEGARDIDVEYTEGCRSMLELMSRLVSREGASSSSLKHILDRLAPRRAHMHPPVTPSQPSGQSHPGTQQRLISMPDPPARSVPRIPVDA